MQHQKIQDAKPFFLLDWLDDLMVNQDAFQIAELLKTPSKLPRPLGHYSSRSHDHMDAMMGDHDDDYDYHHEASNYYHNYYSYSKQQHNNSNKAMPRSISSPEVVSSGTPRSSNRKKLGGSHSHSHSHANSHQQEPQNRSPSHGILPTRLFHAAADHKIEPRQAVIPGESNQLPPRIPSNSRVQTNKTPTRTRTLTNTPGIFKKRSMALGNGWNAKGLTKAKQGQWEAALACWDNALEIRLQITDPSCRKDQLEVANTWNNRGIALGKLGQYHNALEALEEAYQIRNALLGGDTEGHPQVVSTLHNIANVHQQQGDLTTALKVFGKAKSLLAKSAYQNNGNNGNKSNNNDPMLLARICTAIGHIYYQAQQWIDSRDAYQDALNVLLKLDSTDTDSSPSSKTEQQCQIYELQRDIQELNGKISISTTSSMHHHHHHRPPTTAQQSPQH